MKRALMVVGMCLLTGSAWAQPPAGGQRPPMTPEQQAAAAARREAEMKAPRPIDALNSVWMEELTWMEVRDAIAGGKTTALILTGGVESNGPYLATGKHNYILKVMGEAIARKLGNALVAPNGVSLLPIEKTLEIGKKIVEHRATLTVDAIAKQMAAAK